MKIMFITRKFSSDPLAASGVEYYIRSLVNHLSKDHQLTILAPSKDPNKKNYAVSYSTENSIKTYKINIKHNSLKNLFADTNYLESDNNINNSVNEILLIEKPDIVHIHHLGYLSYGIIDKIKSLNIPVIITLHDFCFICNNTHKSLYISRDSTDNNYRTCNMGSKKCIACYSKYHYKRLSKDLMFFSGSLFSPLISLFIKLMNFLCGISSKQLWGKHVNYAVAKLIKADLLLSPSRAVKAVYSQFIKKNKIKVLNLGIEAPKKTPPKKREANEPIIFGYMGGLSYHKGFYLMIDAFNLLDESCLLYMYGSDFSSKSAKKILGKMRNNNNIKYYGIFKEKNKLFSKIDVLVIPSICEETYSLAAREAFAVKVPVIAPNSGAFPELIENNKNGLLFDPGNKSDLKSKMQNIVNDPDLIERFKKSMPALKYFNEHVQELHAIYSNLLDK